MKYTIDLGILFENEIMGAEANELAGEAIGDVAKDQVTNIAVEKGKEKTEKRPKEGEKVEKTVEMIRPESDGSMELKK